ncbi:MAG: lactonase family protein, partial [Bacillota bacterium]|nr:lactonase family protein [Bacillota bacterium]
IQYTKKQGFLYIVLTFDVDSDKMEQIGKYGEENLNMKYNIYISSCDKNGGIYRYILNENGTLSFADKMPVDRPMYLVPEGNNLYAPLRESFSDGTSGIASYSVKENGALSDLGEVVSTKGKVACHLAVENGCIYCVNYVSGSVIKMPDKLVTHHGKGINPLRQEAPHTHYVGFTPDNKYVVVTDLGLDKIYFYDKELNYKFDVSVSLGAGVRHLVFSDNGKYMYAVNELSATVCVFSYGDEINMLGEYNVLPEDFSGENTAAAIRLHNGKLYVSNRGHNSVTCFNIKEDKLEREYILPCGGKGPRDFDIFGDYLVCTNENSDNVTVFDITTKKMTDDISLKTPISVIGNKI